MADDRDDRGQRESGKSEWMGRKDHGAYEPMDDAEKNGLGILGASSVRDGAIDGVGDPVRDGSAAPAERAADDTSRGARQSPEEVERPGAVGDGGLSASGGAAGPEAGGRDANRSIARGKLSSSDDR